MPSVKNNIILNAINIVTAFIFPVITFPYAARVLLPEGIGTINFLNSFISYIILFTSLGIPMYAVKEVARHRDDPEERNKITIEVIIFSLILCIFGYIAVWLLALFVPQIHAQASIFFVLSLAILFNSIGVNWFYQGIEDFKVITIRAVIFRTISALGLFLFVKSPSDLIIYAFILVGSTVGNNILNFIYLYKYIHFKDIKFRGLQIGRHLRPALEVFVLNLLISLYTQLNLIMLGFLAGEEAVGFYTAGNKISHIGLLIVSSISTAIFPRCAHLLKTGDTEGFRLMVTKSLDITLATSWPMMIGLLALAYPITLIFCGPEYGRSVGVLYFTAPALIFISLANVLGVQVLYPKDQIKIVIRGAVAAALFNIILNFILIPHYGATGAAVATLVAEAAGFFYQFIAGRKFYPFHLKSLLNKNYIVASLIMLASIYACCYPIESLALKLVIGIPLGIFVYSIYLYLVKDSIYLELLAYIRSFFHRLSNKY